ncbi:MAG: DUF1501 domain-containing protein [Pirellulales bacterium]|nr:DUF1501 domain-containing protein [Pirellulales bacterium]
MLELVCNRRSSDCEGNSRRDFLKVGVLGLGAVGLPQLLAARSQAASSGQPVKDTSVVWLWLGGGATHVETFDPKMHAPKEYRSTTGEVATSLPGVTFGGTFPKMAMQAHRMAVVRSFAHSNSGHGGGTHWVMTGYDHRNADNGDLPTRPGIGAIVSRVRGANHPVTGMPTYVRLGGIYGDGPAFLGTAYAPFDPGGQAQQNMRLQVSQDRLADRRALLRGLDRLKREADTSRVMEGLDQFEQQAFNLVLNKAPEAFDLNKEDPRLLDQYGNNGIGQQMLLARRLCEAGCGFVTIHYGGWDMHGDIKRSLENLSPAMDHAVATFLEDVEQRGLSDKILLVISGEFGRTPRVNGSAGRDHWAPLSTLALAGGGLKMGQVVGESAPKVDVPKSTPITPLDLMATIFHVLGIDPHIQFVNPAGRPVYMLEGGSPIAELL